MKAYRLLCWLLLGGALAACGSAQQAWDQANSRNSIAGYESFLSQHPDSAHAVQARERIHALQTQQGVGQVASTQTAEAYEGYVRHEPGEVDPGDAHDKMATAERKAAWDWAQSTGTAAAYAVYVEQYPHGTAADQARMRLAQWGGYSAQLASVRSSQEALKVRDRLEEKYGRVLREVVVVPPSAGETLNSVRSVSMTEDEAKSACATLKKAHQSCAVIRSGGS